MKIKEVIKIIREMPNRDDFIGARVLKLDGGGVSRFEVISLIEKLEGDP